MDYLISRPDGLGLVLIGLGIVAYCTKLLVDKNKHLIGRLIGLGFVISGIGLGILTFTDSGWSFRDLEKISAWSNDNGRVYFKFTPSMVALEDDFLQIEWHGSVDLDPFGIECGTTTRAALPESNEDSKRYYDMAAGAHINKRRLTMGISQNACAERSAGFDSWLLIETLILDN